MIRITDQYFWNVVFALFFISLMTMGVIILETESRIPLSDLAIVDYILVTLASWRFVRLFVSDASTKFFREQFWNVKKIDQSYQLEKPKTGPRRTMADLTSSYGSFGIFAGALILFVYLVSDYAVYPVIFLAVSAVVNLLQDISQHFNKRNILGE